MEESAGDIIIRKAYAVASAVQKKCKDKSLRMEHYPLRADRPDSVRLFCFYLSEGGKVESCTAYTGSWFESELNQVAKLIYIDLTQRLDWALRGRKNG